jgi:hypothetical protein
MVNTCRTRLGLDPVVVEDNRWASVGLYYGYEAVTKFSTETSLSVEETIWLGLLESEELSPTP